MKLNNHILSLLAPALLLCAATFGMAGCTQGDDALQGAPGTVSRGGEPIRVSIAPKPGFIPGTGNGTDTRATVGDDGTFGWVRNEDFIYIYITFDDAASTKHINAWGYDPVRNLYPSIIDWFPYTGWTTDGYSVDGQEIVWPLGASRATVKAFYTDVPRSAVGGDYMDPTSLTLDYTAGGTGDHMIYEETLTPGEELVVDFHHATTRLVFNGLEPTTAYSLKAGGTALTFPTVLTVDGFSLGNPAEQTFTSDANGKLTVCAALDEKLNAAHKVTLEVMKGGASGTSVGTVELTAQGSDADGWKMDGYMYTVNFANGGGSIDPDSRPDLLVPAPIVPGNTVWELNGYYITAPDANILKNDYQWSADLTATVMDNDPCAGHGNWRMPSMKDHEKIAGWSDIYPWSQEVGWSGEHEPSDTQWYTIFGDGGNQFWSTDVYTTDDTKVWVILSGGSGAYYTQSPKTEMMGYVRCVQEQ